MLDELRQALPDKLRPRLDTALRRAELSTEQLEAARRALWEGAPLPDGVDAEALLVAALSSEGLLGLGIPGLETLVERCKDSPLAPWCAVWHLLADHSAYYFDSWCGHIGRTFWERLSEPAAALLRAHRPRHRGELYDWLADYIGPDNEALVEIFIRGLTDPAGGVRLTAGRFLEQHAEVMRPRAEQALEAATGKRVRRLLRQALGRLGTESATGRELEPVSDPLAAALTAAETGDHRTALLHLLAGWRAGRAPAVADLVEHVADQVDRDQPPIRARTKAEREARWHEAVQTGDALKLGAALAVPWPSKWRDALKRIRRLASFPADPRIATACVALIEAMPYTSWASMQLWPEVVRLLVALRDPRTVEPFKRTLLEPWRHLQSPHRELLDGTALEQAVRSNPTPPAGAQAAACDALARALGGRGDDDARAEQQLLGSIYDSPGDDRLRLVYADFLSERGDPRGELIMLQCRRAGGESSASARRRESRLLGEHHQTWLGPLAPVVRESDCRFERGFPASCSLEWAPGALKPLIGHPAWATVEEVAFVSGGAVNEIVPLLCHPAMASLRGVHGLERGDFAELAETACRAEEISFRTFQPEVPLWSGLPRLRHLGVMSGGYADLSAFLETEHWGRLRAFSVSTGLGSLEEWLETLGRQPGQLETFRLLQGRTKLSHRPRGWCLTLTPDGAGGFSRLHAKWFSCRTNHTLPDLAQTLTELDRGALTRLTVAPSRAVARGPDIKKAIKRAAARFRRLERLELP